MDTNENTKVLVVQNTNFISNKKPATQINFELHSI